MTTPIDTVEFRPHNPNGFSLSGHMVPEKRPCVPSIPEFESYIDSTGIFDVSMLETLNWMLTYSVTHQHGVRSNFEIVMKDKTIYGWERVFLLRLARKDEEVGLSKKKSAQRQRRVLAAAYNTQKSATR